MTKELILAVNAGSSSLKLGVFERRSLERVSDGAIEWSTDTNSTGDHASALQQLLGDIEMRAVCAVGHRVVQGGTQLRESVVIDDTVKRVIADLEVLAPLHNRAALDGIEAIDRLLPDVPQVASFDTAFHSTLPPVAYHYPIPWRWYSEFGVRRLGFHGLSHAYCAARAEELLGTTSTRRLVSCHLGQGCSVTAVLDGKSVATTMGFTPMDGVMMGTRSGAIDPGIVTHLIERQGMTAGEVEFALNHESGLLGVSGFSSDMRDIAAARDRGEVRATLAFDLFVARLRDAIVTMAAAMEGVDALLFTGGIGEHAADVRAAVCRQLHWIGVDLDEAVNSQAGADTELTEQDSRARVLVIRTQEDLMVARETRRVLGF